MKLLVYSFRSNPFLKSIEKHIGEPFIFASLKKDFEVFEKKILELKPDFVLGIAKSTNATSKFESTAVNRFNKSKKILQDGPFSFSLHAPNLGSSGISVNKKSTDSFCNWVMYRVSHLVETNSLPIHHSFVHIQESDLHKINSTLFKDC